MNVKYLERNDVKLAYRETGKGQAVVLLHGFCGSSSYWDKLLPLLSDKFRFITPDLRGHGNSGTPPGDYTMEAFADDLAGLLKQAGEEQAIVLGHSLGGYITLAFTERYPQMVKAFGLVHSTAFPDSDTAKEGRLKGIETIREKGLPVFIDGLIPKLFAPEHVKSNPDAYQDAVRIGNGTDPEAAARTLEGMRARPDRNKVLSGTEKPVLLVAGEHDQIIPAERVFSVSGGHITQREIKEAGHMSMVEAPEKLAAVITAFITSV